MEISALDVQHKTFRERLGRGYDTDEVEAFLDQVVSSLRHYEVSNREQHEQLENLKRELANAREGEEAIRRMLVAAQKTAQDMTSEATEKSAQLLAQANQEAEVLSTKAKQDSEAMLANAKAESDTMLGRAKEESEAILTKAKQNSEAVLSLANSEAAQSREQGAKERELLMRRVAQLRTAVAQLEDRFLKFAQAGRVELESIGASIDLETEPISELMGGERAEGQPPQPAYLRGRRGERPWVRPSS